MLQFRKERRLIAIPFYIQIICRQVATKYDLAYPYSEIVVPGRSVGVSAVGMLVPGPR